MSQLQMVELKRSFLSQPEPQPLISNQENFSILCLSKAIVGKFAAFTFWTQKISLFCDRLEGTFLHSNWFILFLEAADKMAFIKDKKETELAIGSWLKRGKARLELTEKKLIGHI